MNTKNKGDILAERIETLLHREVRPGYVADQITLILDEYRKPWKLGRSVNGFTLADGQEWHRNDFTQDMLPEGWRPLLMGEESNVEERDSYKPESGCYSWVYTWQYVTEPRVMKADDWRHRTRRPLPAVVDPYAELKKANAEGKTIQIFMDDEQQWEDLNHTPSWTDGIEHYRIKPSLFPLGPEDVKCGDFLRYIGNTSDVWNVVRVSRYAVSTFGGALSWIDLKALCEISRDGGKSWARCEKEAK